MALPAFMTSVWSLTWGQYMAAGSGHTTGRDSKKSSCPFQMGGGGLQTLCLDVLGLAELLGAWPWGGVWLPPSPGLCRALALHCGPQRGPRMGCGPSVGDQPRLSFLIQKEDWGWHSSPSRSSQEETKRDMAARSSSP